MKHRLPLLLAVGVLLTVTSPTWADPDMHLKLSPQGNVHARTLYSVANLATRSAPQDVFAALVASGTYMPVGDNYWHLGER